MQNEGIIGAVSCYENELDDLIVEKSFQGQGIGQKLLLWGMNHIKEQGYEEIILHVAEWNQNAVKLYLKNGFSIIQGFWGNGQDVEDIFIHLFSKVAFIT